MFINPVDRDTINAMVSYHEHQIHQTFGQVNIGKESLIVIRPVSTAGFARAIRQSIGLALIRVGARLAGVGLQSRIGTQS